MKQKQTSIWDFFVFLSLCAVSHLFELMEKKNQHVLICLCAYKDHINA